MKKSSAAPTIDAYRGAVPHARRQAGGRRSSRAEFGPELPLVSILTIVRNGRDALPATIRSVLAQTYSNIEYIVMDGASTDGTVEVIKQFDDAIDRWISEPDAGTSDAMNKAISAARGEYVSWLSAGDWFESDFIETAVKALRSSGADFVFGDLKIYDAHTVMRTVKGDSDLEESTSPESLAFALPARVTRTSPTMVTRRACFERLGLFDLSYRIRNDFEWILRLCLNGGSGHYDSRLIGHFRLGGNSDKGSDFAHIFENLRILRQHRLLTPRVAAPYMYRLVRYSMGHLAEVLLPHTIHRTLRRAMGRSHSVPID